MGNCISSNHVSTGSKGSTESYPGGYMAHLMGTADGKSPWTHPSDYRSSNNSGVTMNDINTIRDQQTKNDAISWANWNHINSQTRPRP
jgi:hypothetical protein